MDPKNSVPKIKCIKEPEMFQPDAFCEHNAAKCDCGRGSVPDPAFRQGRGPGDRGKGKGGGQGKWRTDAGRKWKGREVGTGAPIG